MKRTVLITGGTTRVGAAIADELSKRDWRVITSSHRRDAGADIVADLIEPRGAVKLYAEALRLLDGNPPDAIVNNAALFEYEDEAAITQLNCEAPKTLTMLLAGREAGIGAVVNILDNQILMPIAEDKLTPYLRSKQRLYEFTLKSATMFAQTLRINGVAPGPVLAPANMHLAAGEMLLNRRPTAQDVAEAVAYLLTAEAITGLVIPVDAGQCLL